MGQTALDGQDPALEVGAPQHRQLASARPGVGGEPHQQQGLLSTEEQPPPAKRPRIGRQLARRGLDGVRGDAEDAAHLLQGVVPAWIGSRWALHAIERLVARGLHAEATKARGLGMVLPPRPGGTLAALEAAPHADVVFVAHTGLEHLSSMRRVLEGVPMEHSVRMAWWLVPAEDIPQGEDARIIWLSEWWTRIDAWVRAHAEEGLQPATRLRPEVDPTPPPGPRAGRL